MPVHVIFSDDLDSEHSTAAPPTRAPSSPSRACRRAMGRSSTHTSLPQRTPWTRPAGRRPAPGPAGRRLS